MWPAIVFFYINFQVLKITNLHEKRYKNIIKEYYQNTQNVIIELLGYLNEPLMYCVKFNDIYHIKIDKHEPLKYLSSSENIYDDNESNFFKIGLFLLQAVYYFIYRQ